MIKCRKCKGTRKHSNGSDGVLMWISDLCDICYWEAIEKSTQKEDSE